MVLIDIFSAIFTTVSWCSTFLLWLLLRAQGRAASVMLKRYIGLTLIAWSVVIILETLYYLQVDWKNLGGVFVWLPPLTTYEYMGRLVFRGLLALAILNFLRDILHPQKISTAPMAEAQIQMNPYGVVVAWDEGATELFGWESSEMLGQVLAEKIIPPQYREAHTQGLERYRSTAKAPILNQRMTLPALTKEKGQIVVEFRVKENLTTEGTIFTAIISPAVVVK